MAEKKFKIGRDLGKVTKKLPNGMYETTKGERVPPYPGIEIGDALKLGEDGKMVVPEKEKPAAVQDEAVSRKEFEALKKQNEALAKLLGEKGSNVKVATDA